MNGEVSQRLKVQTARRYSVLWKHSHGGALPEEYHYDRVSRLLPADHLRGTILDAGCGNGIDTLRMAERSPGQVIGVDLSPGGVAKTRQRVCHLANAHVIQADVERLPLRDAQCNFVYSYGVLHHLPHPEQGLTELVRVLKPGGLLAIYLYEDFHRRSGFERGLLWTVNRLRLMTVRVPPVLLYRLCQAASPVVYGCLALPAKVLASVGLQKAAERLPYHHGNGPFSLAGDLYDRFAVPIERRYNRTDIEDWLRRSGLVGVTVVPMRGWVAFGQKAKENG